MKNQQNYNSASLDKPRVTIEDITKHNYQDYDLNFYTFLWHDDLWVGDLFGNRIRNLTKDSAPLTHLDFIKQEYPDFGASKWYFNNSDEIFPHFCQAFEYRVKWMYLIQKHINEVKELPKDMIGIEKILDAFGKTATKRNRVSMSYNLIKSLIGQNDWEAAKIYLTFGELQLNQSRLSRVTSAYTLEYRLNYLEDNSGLYVETRFEKTLRDRLIKFEDGVKSYMRAMLIQKMNNIPTPYLEQSLMKVGMKEFSTKIDDWRYSLNQRDRGDLNKVLMNYIHELAQSKDFDDTVRGEIPFWAFKYEPPPTQQMLLLEPGKEAPEENFVIHWEDLGATKYTEDQANQRKYANDRKSLLTWQNKFGHLPPGTTLSMSEIRQSVTSGSTVKRAEEMGIIEFSHKDGRKKMYRLAFLDYPEKGDDMVNYGSYSTRSAEDYEFYD